MYGVGNWEQVTNVIGSKNPVETELHYMKVFLQSSVAPLPDPTKPLLEEKPLTENNDIVDPKCLRVMHKHQQEDAAGWMPKRQDFLYEWDNEAEEMIGDMELAEDDLKVERDLKAQVLEIYSKKLRERDKRKRFVLQRGMTDNFKDFLATEKKRPKDERELREKLQVFMRFMPQEDVEKLIEGILQERRLRTNIDIMKEGLAHGASTVAEAQRIALDPLKSKSRNPSQTEPSSVSDQTTSLRRQRRTNGEVSISDASAIPNGQPASRSSISDSKDRKSSVLGEVDIEKMVGAELLSKTELTLCAALRISPHQYMIIKEVMIRENARMGCLKKKDAKLIVKLEDPTKVNKIYDFFVGCGWIRSVSNAGVSNRSIAAHMATPNGSKA